MEEEDVLALCAEDESFYGFAPIPGSTGTDSEYLASGSDSPDPKRVDPGRHYDSNDDEEYSGAEELGHRVTDIRESHHGWKTMITRWIESPPALLLKDI